jgi:hypothetical protein
MLQDPYRTDPGVQKWVSIRARMVFAYICSHQPLRDDVVRADVEFFFKEEGCALWDAVFQDHESEEELAVPQQQVLRYLTGFLRFSLSTFFARCEKVGIFRSRL